MPELPDVEILRQYLESTSLHKTIVDVDVSEPALVEGMSVQEFRQPLIHERMTDTARHGKYLLVNLDGRLWMVMHFGMTGGLCYYRRGDPEPVRHVAQVLWGDQVHDAGVDGVRRLPGRLLDGEHALVRLLEVARRPELARLGEHAGELRGRR